MPETYGERKGARARVLGRWNRHKPPERAELLAESEQVREALAAGFPVKKLGAQLRVPLREAHAPKAAQDAWHSELLRWDRGEIDSPHVLELDELK